MSLHVTLSENKTITVMPAQVETLPAGDINIIKITDFPMEKKFMLIWTLWVEEFY